MVGSESMARRFRILLAAVVAVALGISLGTAALAATTGKLKQYKLPTDGSNPRNITEASDGNLWFSESFSTTQTFGHNIGRITPVGDITEFPVCDFCFPGDIAQGPDGFIYFASNEGLGRMTTAGAVEFVAAPFSVGGNNLDVHGDDIWITDFNKRLLWRYDTSTSPAEFTSFSLGALSSGPTDVAVDAQGDVWFGATDSDNQDFIGELDPEAGTTTRTSVTAVPRSIDIATDGKVWFTARFTPQAVGYVDPGNGTTQVFPMDGGPEGIAAAADGSMWFTRTTGGSVAQITPDGAITNESKAIRDSEPFGITVASTGDPWSVMLSANKVATLQLQ
jgi:streptogramin lyase